MTKPRILYRTLSIYQFYKYFFSRLVALAVAAIAFWIYENNPVVTTIIGVLALVAFFLIGESELKVYSDRIKYSVATILPFPASKVFFLRDIKSFRVDGVFDIDVDLNSDFYNGYGTAKLDPNNFIEIELKDDTKISLKTWIYINKLKKASAIIQPLLDKSPYMGYIERG